VPRDRASDDVNRWASRRAPEVLARAEAEAVAILRDALVEAGLRHRADAPAAKPDAPAAKPAAPAAKPAAPATPAAPRADEGELLWAYCVLGASAPQPADLEGIDGRYPIERIEAAGLAALVSRVPASEFGAEPLRENLNDLDWLERVARAHEAVLEAVLAEATIVPLRLCTLYESRDGVRRMLAQEHPALSAALGGLVGREEWGVKFYVEPSKLEEEARRTSDEAAELSKELEAQSEGGAYMLRRRLERHLREVSHALASSAAADVRATLEACDEIDVVMRPPQNRELSGHEGEMLTNAACLVDSAGLERLRRVAAEMEERYAALGARVELTGPWPPYNFVPGGDAAALA
jgi:Gas vesicle synthesis protein GvpL/GvpF